MATARRRPRIVCNSPFSTLECLEATRVGATLVSVFCSGNGAGRSPGHFMNTMSTLEYNTPTLTQEYEYVGEVLLMSMSTQVRRDS